MLGFSESVKKGLNDLISGPDVSKKNDGSLFDTEKVARWYKTEYMDLAFKLPSCSIDIEKLGGKPRKYPIVQIGLCEIDATEPCLIGAPHAFYFDIPRDREKPKTEDEKKGLVPTRYLAIEPACFERFWKSRMETLDKILSVAKPPEALWPLFAQTIDKMRANKPAFQWVTDNPAFDLGTVDVHLEEYANHDPMRTNPNGFYDNVMVYDERLAAFDPWVRSLILKAADVIQVADHNAIHDAENMAWQYIFIREMWPVRHEYIDTILAHWNKTIDKVIRANSEMHPDAKPFFQPDKENVLWYHRKKQQQEENPPSPSNDSKSSMEL